MAGVADRAHWVKAQPAAPHLYPSPVMQSGSSVPIEGKLRDTQSPRELQSSREARHFKSFDLSQELKRRPTRELETLLLELTRLLEEGELPEPLLHALAEKLRPYLMEAG
ncbi:MAG: hypothetical protein NTV14_05795 [Coprothermobacterota bacterium]|nr:hypothetical protein [Coprothermobacterota bacterium]